MLERLFGEHRSALRGFLRVRLGADDEVDDVMQDVFIRLAKMEGLEERLPEGGETNRSFLCAVANNLVLDLERRRAVRRRYADTERAADDGDGGVHHQTPERFAEMGEDVDWLKQVLMGMKPTWRDAFILNRLQHKSYREVAVEMGVTNKQVERFMKSALTHLQKALAERGE